MNSLSKFIQLGSIARHCLFLLATFGPALAYSQQPSDEDVAANDIAELLVGQEIAETSDWLRKIVKLGDSIKSKELKLNVGTPSQEFIFRYVPPGNAQIGLTDDQRISLAKRHGNSLLGHNAKPAFRVRFNEGYFLLDREVTWAQYDALMKTHDKGIKLGQSDDHAEEATETSPDAPRPLAWLEAWDFCLAMSVETGFHIRLPTEFEWEYATRGEEGHLFAVEDEPPLPYDSPEATTYSAVVRGSKGKPIPYTFERGRDMSWCGIVDLSGNLSEWCLDEYQSELATSTENLQHVPSAVAIQSYAPSSTLRSRTFRGGNFDDSPFDAAAPLRRSFRENKTTDKIGLRPALILRLEIPKSIRRFANEKLQDSK